MYVEVEQSAQGRMLLGVGDEGEQNSEVQLDRTEFAVTGDE